MDMNTGDDLLDVACVFTNKLQRPKAKMSVQTLTWAQSGAKTIHTYIHIQLECRMDTG